ncbi:ESPR-type extended signal peptide-containing protein [Veillonella sp. VA139]|uniref:ESPR-type extended signal peptide-containing protein n=1 Tax=Veillonella sp. VA139 TaxID=741830 RepID=UPI000F8DBCC2|nr:ESPR-type extended signal peptide-containing protein [Veillonella sp. VA139]
MGLNHVYKVIWSKTKHCYVVVSELAKRVGRNKVKAAVVQTGTVAAVLAVTALTGSVAQAALNDQGTGTAGVAWGTGSQANTADSVAIGKGAKAENANAIAIGGASKASGDSDIALGNQAKAENKNTVAIGRESKASGESGIALGYQATADKQFTVAIGAGASSQHNNAVAIGKGSQALGATSLALAMGSKATGHDSYAIGYGSNSIGEISMAFGRQSTARGKYDIVLGAEAETRDQDDGKGKGNNIAIGYGAMSGTNKPGKNLNGNDAGGVAIGTGAYTGVNKTNISLNSSVAVGAGAGAGYRKVDTDGLPTDNATDADNNATVLVKAFGGTTGNLSYFKNAGKAKAEGFFSFQGVNINEATALGRNARAIGDQSVAIGAQSVAGQGSIVIGGNDIQAYDGKKYFKAADPNSAAATGVNDFNAETTPGTDKNGNPITITNKYKELVGEKLDNSYRSSYGQDGSTVIGMQAHSTTPLGVAIGTNSIVRKGAFGATAIGSGASVFANAEAAVAIGMGSQAQGNYAVAAGTAAKAKESAVAAGYHAEAEAKAVALGNKSVSKESAVAVGDSSEATNSSVAVGQSAKAQKVADIAVGQGAVASGEQGAIAVGLGTQAQGDSSIMIGGSEITKVAAQTVKYQKEKKDKSGNTVIKTTTKVEHIGGEYVNRTFRSVETEAATGSIQDAYRELTNGATLTTTTLNYSLPANKNGHGSISMGIHSLSTGDLGTAIGTGARVTKLGGVALGTGAISELQNGVAIGTGSKADAKSIGTRQTDISYDKEGHIVPFDSKKVAYTFYWAGGTNTSEGDVVSFGTPGAERQLKNVAAGRIADDSTDAINGSQLNSVTKRMSSGWSVEGEKDHNSTGVLKLKGTEATGQSVNYAVDGKSFTNGEAGTATGQVDKVRLNDEVKIRVGDNLVLNQEDTSRPVYEDPDNKNRQTGTRITSKFTYSLNPVLKNLTSATFKNDTGDTTVINGAGVTVTPVTTGKQPVSLTTSGLNNGGNAISNVAGNLPDTKNNTATKGASNATKSQEAPTLGSGTNEVNPTNAATVSDVLNAGWNLQGNNAAVDFVKPYDTVNFINGDGTTATVESTDGKTSTVKYSVNLGDGLEKDANNKIAVKAADKSLEANKDGVKVSPGDKSLKTTKDGLIVNTADKSLEVTNDGLKVKTDGKTITTDNTDGLKVVTGEIEPVKTGADPGTNTGTVKVKDNDAGKIATVDTVVSAVNTAAWTATSGSAGTGTVTGTSAELIKAGNTVTFKAGDNLAIKQEGKNFIYSLKPALSGLTSAEFKDANNNTVNITPTGITITKPADTATNTPEKTVKLNQDGLDNGGNTITNVKSGLDTYGGNVPGTTDKNTGLVNLSKPTAGEPKVSDNTAATVGDIRNMGWIVSSNKTTGENGAVTTDEYSATVKNANEVKFVGAGSAIVSGKTEGNVRTITVKVDDQTSTNNAVTPVVYTDENGNRVYPTGKKDDDGNQIFNTKPDGKGTTVIGPVKTTVNGPKGISTPTTISNVEGNLAGAKTGTDAPTTSATAPTLGTGTNQVNKNNAATVGDVLNAGWNLQGDGAAVDFVKSYDTVNFVKGDGTSVTVESADGKTSTVKYSVNLGNGLQKDTTGNTISVKPADKSLAVGTDGVKVNPGDTSLETTTAGLTVKKADSSLETTTDGLKVKTDGTTITTDGTNGLKVVTGDIEPVTTGTTAGTVKVKDNDAGKIATVDTVAKAVNDAAFTLKASATTGGTRNADSGVDADGESIKAGSTVEMIAGKNLDVKHDTSGKITFATVENPSFNTIQVGGSEGPKFSKTADGNISVSDKDGTEPVKITNVKDGDISKTSKDAINGSQFHAVAKNTIKLAGQNGTAAATETDEQSLDKTGGIKFTVKSSDGALLDVTAAGDTLTLTPKIGTITSGNDGVPTANTTDGKLVTADQLVTALTKMGWKATAGQDDDGTVTDATVELIKAGNTVTFKAGNNLAVKQAGKNFTYSLQKELTGLTSAKFKDDDNNTVNITPTGITITKPADTATNTPAKTVKLNQDGLDNGGNAITNVSSKLENYNDPHINGKAPVKNGLRNFDNNAVPDTNAATVGDIRNMGWIVSSNKTTGANGAVTTDEYSDTVKNANEVKFVGEGSAIVSGKTDGNVRTITVKVDNQTGINKTVTPVNYTKADGTKVYPQEVDNGDGTKTVKFFENPDGSGAEIPANQVITSVNGPEGTTKPTTLSNVKSNLPDTQNSTTANTEADPSNATKSQVAPTLGAGANEVNKNNAATVGDVLNAGWNLQGNGVAKDFVKPYDTVNFVNGDGTTATVESADGKTSTVKYSVNLGNGLEKDANNKIAVKAADGSISSTAGGISVNVDGTTIGKANDGTLQAITGAINEGTNGDLGKVVSNTGDGNKLATVNTVVNAINNAAWTANSEAEGTGTATGSSPKLIKAGDIVVYKAGNNLAITQAGKNFTYSLKETLTGLTSAEFKDANKNTVNITPTGITITKPADTTTNTPEKNVKLNQDGLDNGGNAITNVKANLPETQNSNKANTVADPSNATKSQAAPNTTNKTGTDYINPNNAATVGDVLNAGWNLQGNGTAVDFVKPYDTVNFVNGLNTTAVVSTVDGVTSNVTYNVTGLPITYTDKDGNPVSKIGDNFYKVNDKGQPLDANGNPSTKVNNDGKPVDDAGNVINPIDTTNNPVKTSLVNPSPEAGKTGTSSPTTLDNVTSKLEKYNDPTVDGKTPVRNSLVDLSKPTDGSTPKVSDNTVATVGDLRNMGWIVSSDKNTDDLTKDYSDIVKNANEVKFVGEGTAIVSGKTDGNVRTITVKVDDQTSTNNAVTPVVYTDKDGNRVYPTGKKAPDGNEIFNTQPDGKGNTVTGPVKTTVNGPNGTNTPTSLSNVKNNIPTVNDEDKTAHNTDGTVIGGKNNTEAPITAGDAANLLKPTVNGAANPNFVGNNAATVSDVLNAGWNLQNNGTAKDFVKPYDTVNFVNGLNTTAVVTTSDDGTTSNVTYNVTGLPVTYTTADGTPVTKIGDKYYKVNDQGQPVDGTGAPVTKFNKDGKPLDATGHEIPDINITDNPLKTSLVNPKADTGKTGTTTPTTLSNIKSNLPDTKNNDATTGPSNATTAQVAPNTTNKAGNDYINPNNAATVGDVLNAGWNLQGNGVAKDFVKPYDTVNFVNGLNTTAVVSTVDGKTSNVTYNVTGLPITYTDKDGNPVSKIGDKYYKVNDKGQPLDANGNPSTKVNNDGKPVDDAGNVINPIDTTNNPVKTSLVNPTPETGKTGTSSPTTLDNVTSKLTNYNGAPVNGKDPVKNGLRDLTNTNVTDNTVATVGDLRNMGWIVSSDKTTDALTTAYSDTVKNANEVKFVGEGTAIVSGKTDGNVRTITVKVDDQTSTNNAVTPVNYTKKDGTKVYPKEITNADGSKTVKFYPNPDGTGTEVPDSEVITSVNGPKGTKTPTTLSNVEGNLDGAKTNTTAPTTEATAPNTNNVAGSNYVNPHNAATVGDVLSAGWNLQGNGVAKDFVKPYDTVNFVNGINTTAVVTTSDDGTTSNVTYNVTGLPVTYTTADGTPVSKIGDKYYKVNDQGQPVDANGNPVTKFNKNGVPVDAAGQPIPDLDITTNPLITSVVNPKSDTGKTGTTTPTTLSNVESNLDGAKTGTQAPTDKHDAPNTTNAAQPNYVNTHNAATVGDVLQAGWNLQNNGTAKDFVKPYDTVNFVNGGNTTAVVTTKADGTTSDVTFNVTGLPVATTISTPTGPVHLTKVGDNYYPVKGDGTPDIQTGADGHPTNGYVKANDGNYYPAGDVTYNTDPATNATTIAPKADKHPVTFSNTLTNPNVSNTDAAPNNSVSSPTSLGNVKNNLDSVNDGTEVITKPDGTVVNKKPNKENITKGSITAEEAAKLANPKLADGSTNPNYVGNNAATVSDVLNAGWNLTGNGTAVDFVKPYDTVNFRNGGNTTVSVTTDDNLTSHVQVNVTGLPVSNTITDPATGKQVPVVKVGDAFYRANPDGTPNIVRDAAGKPTNGYVRANDGKLYPREDVNVTPAADPTQPPTITPKNGKTPTTVNTNLVNPNVDNTTDNPGNNVSTPNQLGNVANGAKTFVPVAADGTKLVQVGDKFYPADKVQDGALKPGTDPTADAKDPVKLANDGKWYKASEVEPNGKPKDGVTPVANPLAPKNADGDILEKGNDGKWYKADELTNGKPNNGATVQQPVAKPANSEKSGLIDFTNSNPNNVATIGDLQNMGWVVSAEGNNYSDQVRNANEVKFVGEGTATVTGKTDVNGVRTITVKVDDQTSTNNSVTPINYTKADGTKVYPKMVTNPVTGKEELKFFENPDGSGNEVPKGDVITSINGPEGTTSPTTLKNVKNNIPNVNDGTQEITKPDGSVVAKTPDQANINKAPLTAEEAAELANPKTKDGLVNPKYIGSNAATVSDVLNAGWNLQGNGVAKDFVKPYDTVNFVNGGNTTAVVTTNAEGTASNVTFNVTGLPMTYTTADGTPVSKIGDKYYKVNEKGQPVDANGKPSTKVNNNGEPLDENGVVIQPINTAATPLSSKLVNPNVSNSDAEPNKQTTSPTQLGNVTSGLQKYGDKVNGKPVEGTTPANTGLIDLSKPVTGEPKVSDNTAATVGDLRNMGWIVSSDKTTNDDGTATVKDYTEQVKNANEVKFVGKGTAIVSGKTVDGVRTITVKVDDQVSTNNAIMPTSFTTKDGKKVYPVKDDAGNVTYHTTPDGKGTGDTTIDPSNVVTSVNGPNGTTTPTTLQNVKSNIPNVNDGSKTITAPDGTEKAGDVENINKAPLTAEDAAKLSNPKTADGTANPNYIGNNAATVSDVLNAGWNLQGNGVAKDFVKPYDTVNFINGRGTTAVVTTREGNTTSDVTFNVKPANSSVTVDEDGVKVTTGEITSNTNGSVAGPTDPATAKQLKATLDAAVKELATAKDALKTAEEALAKNPTDPALQQDVADKKAEVAAKQTPVNDAQKAHDDAGLNKIATVQNVAEAINNAGFNLKTSEADGGKKLTTGTKNDGELIKPGNTVEMVAGNNLTVKQDTDGKITYATKDDVTFKTVDTGTLNVGSPNTFTDGKGNTYTKVGNDYYNPSDVENGAPKLGATPVTIPADVVVKPVSPVTMKTEAAKPATNNGTDAPPSSALNITSKDGKPTQITGVGSTLNTNVVKTNPEGTATKPGTTPKTEDVHLVDLKGTDDAPVNKNAAATVGDLQNMGWVVSAKDGNGYKDVVKNANVVDFKGGKGIEITGNTLADGTREITVGIKEGEVTNKVTITHGDGTKTDAVKIGDNYYKVDKDGKPIGFDKDENGKPAGTPLTIDPTKDKVTNNGAGFVTGNTVANAIQDSGWNVGKANISDVKKSDGTAVDFNKEAKVYDTVNPNDDVKFVDGANANVSMVTVDALNKDGTKKATTFVKVDVNRDLKIDSLTTGGTVVDKNGNNLVKVGDDYYKESDIDPVTKQPKADAKPVPPAKDGKDLVKVGDKYYEESDIDPVTKQPKANAKPVSPAKDGEMIVKNADGKDVVSATVGKDGSGVFGVNGKDGKDGVSITAKDGEGAIGVNGKDGKNTSITGDSISIKDKDNKNSTEIGINSITLKDKDGNTSTLTADKSELIDKDGNTNTSTSTTITLEDKDKNTNTSTATGTTYTDKDKNTTTVGPKEIVLRDKDGNNTSKLTNNDLLLNTKDPNTGVEKTSHMSGDKIAFTTTDEIEKDSKGNPVIDPKTNQPKIKNPGNSTEYTNEGLKVIPNSTVARDANGNPTFLDKTGKPVMKDTDGKYKYVGQDGKPGKEYTGGSGSLKPNVVDTTRVISFGMDKPVLDANGNPVKGPDGKPVMTEGISAGMQQIHNVAPGTKDTDAVNVSQLKGMANVVMNVNNRVNRVGAQAAALAGLQSLQYDPLEPTQISAGLGYYKGAGALALGVNHFKNESTMFHMGASFNGRGDETMMNASVTWKFGARADETAVKDTFRQGPISASYTLQDKVSALEAQNQIQKDQLNELRATNAAQKAENEAQREELALMKAQIAELFKRMNG